MNRKKLYRIYREEKLYAGAVGANGRSARAHR